MNAPYRILYDDGHLRDDPTSATSSSNSLLLSRPRKKDENDEKKRLRHRWRRLGRKVGRSLRGKDEEKHHITDYLVSNSSTSSTRSPPLSLTRADAGLEAWRHGAHRDPRGLWRHRSVWRWRIKPCPRPPSLPRLNSPSFFCKFESITFYNVVKYGLGRIYKKEKRKKDNGRNWHGFDYYHIWNCFIFSSLFYILHHG